MAESGFPGQHTTTTTVTSNTTVQTNVRFDPIYIRTLPGILKVAQIVLNLLGFICVQVANYQSTRGEFFNFVSMTGFWFTGLLLAFYLFHLIEKLYKIPWLKIELGFCLIWVILYLIASSMCAALSVIEAFSVAAFFGFSAMVVYGYDAFLKYRSIQAGELAQGERVITKQTTTSNVNSPTY